MLQSKQSSLCGLHRSRDRGRGGPNGQIVSVKRAADRRRQRGRKIINEERKVQGQERIVAEHLGGLEKNHFCDFDRPHKRAYQKGKIEPIRKERKGLWKRTGCQTESKALEKSIVDRIVREPGLGLLKLPEMD